MIPVRWRAPMLVAFLTALHLLALIALWRRSDGRLAGGIVIFSALPLALTATYLLDGITRRLSWLDLWVLAYVVWSVLSVLLYFQPGNPSRIGAFAYGLYHFVLPIACYFAAKSIPLERRDTVLNGVVLLNIVAIGYGIFLHFTRPDFYTDYITTRLAPSGATEEWQFFGRLQSYVGSTSVGYLGAVSLVIATMTTKRLRRAVPVLALLFVAGTALSLQRASLVGVGVALLYLLVASHQHIATRILLAATLFGALGYGVYRLQNAADPLVQRVTDRVTVEMAEGFSGFREDRGYGPGVRYLRDFPLGVGLGGTSSAADLAGLVRNGEVADANFMRIAADLGVPGLLLFLTVLAGAAWRAWTSEHRAAWLAFLVVHCGIMLSTNVLDSFYVSHSFWVMLALIDLDHPPAPAGAITEQSALVPPLAAALGGPGRIS